MGDRSAGRSHHIQRAFLKQASGTEQHRNREIMAISDLHRVWMVPDSPQGCWHTHERHTAGHQNLLWAVHGQLPWHRRFANRSRQQIKHNQPEIRRTKHFGESSDHDKRQRRSLVMGKQNHRWARHCQLHDPGGWHRALPGSPLLKYRARSRGSEECQAERAVNDLQLDRRALEKST